MQKVWGRSEMEEKALLCSVAEVTLSKLGEELQDPKAEVLGAGGRWIASRRLWPVIRSRQRAAPGSPKPHANDAPGPVPSAAQR